MSQVCDSPCRGYQDLYSKWHDKSELSFLGDASGRFPDHSEFQSWIVNFRTEVCSKAKNPTLALQWIKEIEAAESLDDLITPKSITGKDLPNFEELELMMATALKRCYDKQTHFRKKISVEEQRAQKDNRFLRGRQICDDDMARYFLSQIENGHKSDSETHKRRDKPDTRATETWLEANNYD